jgi:hypothetical protein
MVAGIESSIPSRRTITETYEDAGALAARNNSGEPTADYDAKWGGFVIDGKNFTGLVYQGV